MNNVQAQRDLTVSYSKLGMLEETVGKYTEAVHNFRGGIVVLKRMIADGINIEESRKELTIFEKELAHCENAQKEITESKSESSPMP